MPNLYAIAFAIQDAAYEAAQSSLSAHGHYVPAQDAWQFITMMWSDSEDTRLAHLPRRKTAPARFVSFYNRITTALSK
jgi:hypothetical protein